MWLKSYLIVTGIGAFIALTMPSIVVIASFLIIPGIILGIMPTAFMYGVAFAVFRMLLGSYFSGVPLNLLSAVGTLALFWVIPQPGLMAARNWLASLKEPDVLTTAPIELKGNILITRPDHRCDQLCVALLKTPDVTSVSISSRNGRFHTYRIAAKSVSDKLVKPIGYGLLEETKYVARDPLAGQRALEAEWNLMLSEGKALVAGDDKPEPHFTITIEDGFVAKIDRRRKRSLAWSLKPSTPQRTAMTISNANGQVLLRQSILWNFTPTAPLVVGTSGGINNFEFGWQRERLGDGKKWATVPVIQLLLDHTNIARGVNMQAAEAKAREELERALNDPLRPAGDPAFSLANQWMASFQANDRPLGESDRKLLARIYADSRVASSDGSWAMIARVNDDALDLRRSAARRYLAASDKKEARYWINTLEGLPTGAFAKPLPEENEILADPAVSRYAWGLIKRQSDRGVDAVPDLLRLLREYSTYDPGQYGFGDLTESINAVRNGFRRIGSAASFARPEIEQLLASPGLGRRYKNGKGDWDTLLVVLGRPVETLSKPENLSGTDASYRERLAQRAAKPYDPRTD